MKRSQAARTSLFGDSQRVFEQEEWDVTSHSLDRAGTSSRKHKAGSGAATITV